MSSAKTQHLVQYCRIFQWIGAQDDKFAEAIRDACLEGVLSPGGRSSGITFLYPDAKYRAEFIEAVYSSHADDADTLFRALVLPEVLHTGDEFKAAPVGNLLGVKLPVESASATKVNLEGGVELQVAKDFITVSRKSNLAVWLVKKGRPPATGEPYTPRPKPREPKHTGGGGSAAGIRQRLTREVEAAFDTTLRTGKAREYNVFLAKVLSLYKYLKSNEPDLCAALSPLFDYDPMISYYILMQPYKAKGPYLVPDEVLEAWGGHDLYRDAVKEYLAIFDRPHGEAGGKAAGTPWIYRDDQKVKAAADEVRQAISSTQQPRLVPGLIKKAYEKLWGKNTIAGLDNVLPQGTIDALGSWEHLYWIDQFRFHLGSAIATKLRIPGYYDPHAFRSVIDLVRTSWPGDDYGREVPAVGPTVIGANEACCALLKYLGSTDFLYTPPTPGHVGPATGSLDLDDAQIYNRTAQALRDLRTYAGMTHLEGFSPATRAELKAYRAETGSSTESGNVPGLD